VDAVSFTFRLVLASDTKENQCFMFQNFKNNWKHFPKKMWRSFSIKHTWIIVLKFVQVVIELQKSIENISRKRHYKLQALPVSNDPFPVGSSNHWTVGNNWKHFQKRCDKLWVLTVLNDPFEVQARNVWTAKKPIENHFQKKMWQTLSTTNILKWTFWSLGK
jgi:hypothetical protein